MRKTSWILFLSLIVLNGCKPLHKQNKYENLRHHQIKELLILSIQQSYKQLDLGFERVAAYAKSKNNSKVSLQKVSLFYSMQKRFFAIEKVIINCIKALEKGDFKDDQSLFVTSSDNHPFSATKFKTKLDEYSQFLNDKYQKYLPDTTFWSKRYLKQFSGKRDNLPDFEHFYFDKTSKEETIHLLRVFQLAIAQEELAIQQKILEEK